MLRGHRKFSIVQTPKLPNSQTPRDRQDLRNLNNKKLLASYQPTCVRVNRLPVFWRSRSPPIQGRGRGGVSVFRGPWIGSPHPCASPAEWESSGCAIVRYGTVLFKVCSVTQLSQVDGVQELQEFSASRANKFERRQYFQPL